MVEGGGSRDFPVTRALAYQDPSLFDRIIDLLTAATLEHLTGQVEAGAEAIMLFDTWAGILPPAQFRQYVIAPTRRIIDGLRRRWPGLPIIGFPRLAGIMLGEYAANVTANAVGIDTAADPALAACLVPNHVALQGNLDPLALVAGGDAMRRAVRTILEAMHGRAFIFNLGHGVLPQTPPEHVTELVRLVRAG
jgi:uroporphyrinogen decarboxylase